MKLPVESNLFLTGEKFASSYQIEFQFDEEDYRLKSTPDILKDLAKDRKVIHVGCVDHNLKNLKEKRQKGLWLHEQLDNVSSRCFGVDINADAIAYLRDSLGFQDVAAIDLTKENLPELINTKWDYIILGEMLEHLDQPVEFLRAIHTKYRANIGQLIVTVPNAFNRRNHIHAKQNRERINSDHRFWFTPFTLAKLLTVSGFSVAEMRLTVKPKQTRGWSMKTRQLKKYPLLRVGLLAIANF